MPTKNDKDKKDKDKKEKDKKEKDGGVNGKELKTIEDYWVEYFINCFVLITGKDPKDPKDPNDSSNDDKGGSFKRVSFNIS